MADVVSRQYPFPTSLLELYEAGVDRPQQLFISPIPNRPMLNLGAGPKEIRGTVPMDADRGWFASDGLLGYDDQSVGAVVALNFLEHLNDDDFYLTMREVERIMMPGAPFNISVPHWSAEIAYEDQDHKRHFSEGSWHNLFRNDYYTGSVERGYKFRIATNMVMGVVQRNLCIFTQLIRVNEPVEGNKTSYLDYLKEQLD
jgi:hypothetical protein